MNWIALGHIEKSRERSETLQLHRERVAEVKRPAMWREFSRCVRTEIRLFLQFYSGADIKVQVDTDEQGFFIRKSNFPHVTVDCKFLGERIIELRFCYRRTDNADKIEWEDRLDFHVDELDRVQFQHKGQLLIDARDACKLALRPIIDPSFRPPG